jgi:hypothetical protein
MTTTMTFTTTDTTSHSCCPNCGVSFLADPQQDPTAALLQAQKTIAELQSQVRLLNQKAAAAVDRWADYEDELARLRAASATPPNNNSFYRISNAGATSNNPSSNNNNNNNGRTSFLGAGASRISALLSPRKSASPLQPPPPPTPPHSSTMEPKHLSSTSISSSSLPLPSIQARLSQQPTEAGVQGLGLSAPSQQSTTTSDDNDSQSAAEERDLRSALSREQSLRRAAEGRLDATSREVEELSVTLFEQANEMVASERRARARLEERVELLERRDVEKRGRLERLETAMTRIDRVGRLLERTSKV